MKYALLTLRPSLWQKFWFAIRDQQLPLTVTNFNFPELFGSPIPLPIPTFDVWEIDRDSCCYKRYFCLCVVSVCLGAFLKGLWLCVRLRNADMLLCVLFENLDALHNAWKHCGFRFLKHFVAFCLWGWGLCICFPRHEVVNKRRAIPKHDPGIYKQLQCL